MIQKYSTKEKLLEAIMINMEVQLTTFVYLINLSFYHTHLAYLMTNPTSMEQSMNLMVVLFRHFTIIMLLVLCVMFPLEYHI